MSQVQWYAVNRDNDFTKAFLKNLWSDIDSLCAMPMIGRSIPKKGNHEYRVFISHKKCLVKYWYDTKTLTIVDIVFTDTLKNRLF